MGRAPTGSSVQRRTQLRPQPTACATRSLLHIGAGDATTNRSREALPAPRPHLERRHVQRPYLHLYELRDGRDTRRRRRPWDVHQLARRFNDVINCGHDQRLARRAPCSSSAPATPRPAARATRSLLRVGTCNAVTRNVATFIRTNCSTVVIPYAVADDGTCTNWLGVLATYTTVTTTNGLRDALPAPRRRRRRHDQSLARRAPCSASAPATPSRAPSPPASVQPARRS